MIEISHLITFTVLLYVFQIMCGTYKVFPTLSWLCRGLETAW